MPELFLVEKGSHRDERVTTEAFAIPEGVRQIALHVLLEDTDCENDSLSIPEFGLEQFHPKHQEWWHLCSCSWRGGKRFRRDGSPEGNPTIAASIGGDLAGRQIRGFVRIEGPISLGLSVEFFTE